MHHHRTGTEPEVLKLLGDACREGEDDEHASTSWFEDVAKRDNDLGEK